MEMGKHHDWVLDRLSLPQVFLYWANIGIVAGYGKRPRRGRAALPSEDGAHDWVWDRATRRHLAFNEEEREHYEWNAELRQFEK